VTSVILSFTGRSLRNPLRVSFLSGYIKPNCVWVVSSLSDHIQLYQQKELLSLVLHKAILAPDSIKKVAIYKKPPEIELFSLCETEIRSQTPIWLPG